MGNLSGSVTNQIPVNSLHTDTTGSPHRDGLPPRWFPRRGTISVTHRPYQRPGEETELPKKFHEHSITLKQPRQEKGRKLIGFSHFHKDAKILFRYWQTKPGSPLKQKNLMTHMEIDELRKQVQNEEPEEIK